MAAVKSDTKTADAEIRRDARDQGIEVARIQYGDTRAPLHFGIFRRRDGARLHPKAFKSEPEAWEAMPLLLTERAFQREAAAREEAERAERYRAAAAEKRINSAKLPPELQNIDLDSFPESKARDVAKRYVSEFEDRMRDGKGLVFVGSGIQKLQLAAATLEAITRAGFSGRFMTVFDVEMCEIAGISAISSPDVVVLACYEAGATIRNVIRARGNKPTVLVASCSLDRLKDLVLFDISDENAALGLNGWEQMERRAEIVVFAKEEK
jgi:hypothetical protein